MEYYIQLNKQDADEVISLVPVTLRTLWTIKEGDRQPLQVNYGVGFHSYWEDQAHDGNRVHSLWEADVSAQGISN
jgi:hypothetical protein